MKTDFNIGSKQKVRRYKDICCEHSYVPYSITQVMGNVVTIEHKYTAASLGRFYEVKEFDSLIHEMFFEVVSPSNNDA